MEATHERFNPSGNGKFVTFPRLNEPAPPFQAKTTQGPRSLADYRGRFPVTRGAALPILIRRCVVLIRLPFVDVAFALAYAFKPSRADASPSTPDDETATLRHILCTVTTKLTPVISIKRCFCAGLSASMRCSTL